MSTMPAASVLAVRIGGRRYPVLLPKLRDPRLHVAAVIVSVQVLGQVVLGFDVSVAQILMCLGTAAVLEVGIVAATSHVIAWPASALLTGNGVALLLRTPGTEHGDWWATNGWPIFVAAAGVSLLSKYAIRVGDRHLFNPSNFGLVVVFLLFGSQRADPQDLWWGPLSVHLAVTVAVILVGGITLSRRLRLFSVAVTFWVTFAAAIGLLAATGHAITARWHLGPVSGWTYFWVFVLSPEIVIFLFFMITDPKTAPVGRTARPVYAALVGMVAGVLVGLQRTEFASKVALLAALTLVCAARPLLERSVPHAPRLDARAAASMAGAAVLWVAAVLGAGAIAGDLPEVRTGSVGEAVGGRRPAVDLPPSAVPVVVVDGAFDAIAGAVTDSEAQVIGRDLVENLTIEGESIADGDVVQAATAAFGARLRELTAQIAANRSATEVVVPRYEVERMLLVLLRDPTNPQSVPQFGMQVAGAVTEVTRGSQAGSAAAGGPVVDQVRRDFEHLYLVTLVGDHYLVGAVLDPASPMVVGGARLSPG